MPDRLSLPKAIGWSIAFVVLTLMMAGLLAYGVAVVAVGSSERAVGWLEAGSLTATMLQSAVMLVSIAVFTWLIGFRVLRLTAADLRYTGRPRAGGFLWGGAAGMLVAGLSLAVASVIGGAEWTRDQGTPLDWLQAVSVAALVLAPAALSEELLFRGVPLVLLARGLGRGTAIVLLAIVFAVAHLTNPNVTMLGVGNIALAGIFLGLAFYAPGGIWTAWGAHLGWNTLLVALDAPVSGVPFGIPFVDYAAGDPSWLTGGRFGPEGGLASTLALTIAVLLARRWAGKDRI